ncbi:MAG: gliding motility-associated C-terminal domain-containing protein, partial [Flavobacteriaceae bacterium]
DGKTNLGDHVSYAITVANTGNVNLTNITITDINADTGRIANQTGDNGDSILNVGEFWTYAATHTITQGDLDAGQVNNLAVGSGTTPKGNTVTDESTDPTDVNVDPDCKDCSTIVQLNQKPALSLKKDGVYEDTNANGIIDLGDRALYTFTLTNTGNVTVTNLVILDALFSPSTLEVVPSVLEPGQSVSVAASYTLTQADIDLGAVYNIADVTGLDPKGKVVTTTSEDPTPVDKNGPYNDAGCDKCTVIPLPINPGIALIKTANFNDENNDGHAQVGETISYSFYVTNTGNVTLNGIVINDPLVLVKGGPISLLPGESDSTSFSAIYAITQSDIIAGSVSNQATVTGNYGGKVSGQVTDVSDDDSPTENDITTIPIEGCVVKVFNAVSPNSDGQNDVFYIQGLDCYPDNTVEIYNRWGVKVFEATDYGQNDNYFKGISNGRVTIEKQKQLPVGTYFYILKYKNEHKATQSKAGYLYLQQ